MVAFSTWSRPPKDLRTAWPSLDPGGVLDFENRFRIDQFDLVERHLGLTVVVRLLRSGKQSRLRVDAVQRRRDVGDRRAAFAAIGTRTDHAVRKAITVRTTQTCEVGAGVVQVIRWLRDLGNGVDGAKPKVVTRPAATPAEQRGQSDADGGDWRNVRAAVHGRITSTPTNTRS